MSTLASIQSLLGAEADSLLSHKAKVSKDLLHLPTPSFVDGTFAPTDRSPQVLRSLQAMFGHGRLANTGYLSILPVDQGIEDSAGASFAPNPIYLGMIDSGGASGTNDMQDATATAVVNKRAGGCGLISGRKAFQKPMEEGIAILNTIQDVYLCDDDIA